MAANGKDGGRRAAMRDAGGRALRFVMIALACYGAAWLGRRIPAFEGVPLIALPTGVALAALWRCGFSWWPGVFVGALAAALTQGQSLPVAASLAVAGTAGPIAAVALGGRYGYQGGNSRRDLVVLALAGAIGACLSAALGVGTLVAAGHVAWADAGARSVAWWLADIGGIALATPFLLALSTLDGQDLRRRWLEATLLVLATVAVAATVAGVAPGTARLALPVSFLAVPPLAWAALRFGVPGASLATLVVAAYTLAGTARGQGPFVLADPMLGLAMLWAYLFCLAVLGLLATLLRSELTGAEAKLTQNLEALRTSQRLYEELVGSLPVGVYRARAFPSGAIVYEYASPLFCAMFDLAPEPLPSTTFRDRILARIHPDDRASLEDASRGAREVSPTGRPEGEHRSAQHEDGPLSAPVTWTGRVIVGGQTRWMEFRVAQTIEERGERAWFGVASDVTERRRIELSRAGERAVFEGLAKDEPLPVLLTRIVGSFEQVFPGALGSILLLDPTQRRLQHGAAPHLPPAYVAAIDGAEIGPAAGSCGTAAHSGKTVIVTDIASDPLWRDYRELALSHGLAACWSAPVFSSRRDVLGTFAIYYREQRSPGPGELAAIERGSHLASLAIERRAALQALAESEARYRTLYNHTPAMQVSTDLDENLVGVSDYWLASMGYRREEVLGRPFADFLTPASARLLREVGVPEFRRQGVRHNLLLQQVRKSGEVIDVLVSTSALRDAQGEIVHALSSIVDITERKRLETQREYENAILEAMAAGAPEDEILVRIVTAYQAMYPGMIPSILRVSADGAHLGGCIGPGLPESYRRAVEGIAIGPGMCSCGSAAWTRAPTLVADIASDPLWRDYRDTALEHGLAACWSFPILDSTGAAIGTFAQYYREVRTPGADEIASLERGSHLASLAIERARAQDALGASEARFRRFYNETPALLYSFDAGGRFVAVSDYWLEVTGYTRDDVIGRPVADVVHEDFRRELKDDRADGSSPAGFAKDAPCRLVKKNGETIDVVVSAMPERDTGGDEPAGPPQGRMPEREARRSPSGARSLAVMTDVTERNRAEAALKQHGENLAALHRFTLDLLDRRDMGDLLQTVVERAAAMVGAPFAGLALLEGERLAGRAYTRNQPFLTGDVFGRDEGLIAWQAIDTREPVVVDDYSQLPQRRRIYDRLGLRGAVNFPILLRGESIGVLSVGRTEPGRRFTAEEIQRGMLFAQMAALVIDHLRVYEAAVSELAERTRTAASLREQEARLAGIVDSAIDAIITVDDAQRIVVFNRAAEAVFGVAEADALGAPLDRFIPEHARVVHREYIERFNASGTSLRGKGQASRLHGCRANGELFPIDASISRIEIAGRAVSTVMLRDVSGQVAAEAARDELEAKLREAQKLEAVGTLAAGVAHDFNNIVAAILGNVDLLRDELGPGHAAQRSVEEIRKAGDRARELVRHLVAFSHNEPLQLEVLDLCAVIADAIARVAPTLPAGVEIAARLPDAGPFVEGDAVQLRQVVVQLCTNARHALRGAAGVIDVALDTLDVVGTPPPGLGRGRYAHLTVRDHGVGMDAAMVERIFEPFYTTRAPGDGAGLGLSVVHGIVRSHHGSVDVASEPGQGSTFHVYLPAVAPPAATRPPAVAAGGGHVLYVDDDEALVFLVTRMLERQGLKVTGCFRAADALAAIRADAQRFDLLLTDYNMPGMTGIELVREVVRLRPDLPVVLTSGYITDEVRAAAVHAGIRHLVYKPNTVDELCDVVLRLLQDSRAGA